MAIMIPLVIDDTGELYSIFSARANWKDTSPLLLVEIQMNQTPIPS